MFSSTAVANRERDRRARQWRTARINRFAERQRQTREWINFAEIAEWCSKEDQSIVPSKEKRAAAFNTLTSDLLAGEFEENGRSRVLYLHPATAKARMARDWLQDAIAHNYDGEHGRSDTSPIAGYSGECLSGGLQSTGCRSHRRAFRPQKSYHVSGATAGDETAAIKALASQLRSAPG